MKVFSNYYKRAFIEKICLLIRVCRYCFGIEKPNLSDIPMKKLSGLIIIFLCVFISLPAQEAFTPETVPNPKNGGTGYVSDPDDVLDAASVAELNRLIAQLEDSSTAQIAVVVLNSIGQENPKDFATRLFNYWGIGQADTDNGLLVLTVMDQHRTEFETGYGLEAVLTDAMCYRIGMQELVPEFKKGNYGAGLIAAVSRIKQMLEKGEVVEEIRSRKKVSTPLSPFMSIWLQVYLLANLVFHLWWLWRLRDMIKAKDDFYDKYVNVRKLRLWGFLIAFPLPFVFVWFYLKKKMNYFRNAPRYNKVTGELMRKLSEEEEDEYLERGQVMEEEIGSVDYDVWVTDSGEDFLILKYEKYYSKFIACPECGFKTYYLSQTKTLSRATTYSTGKQMKIYECKNCAYTKEKIIILPKIQRSSGGGSGSGGGGGSSFGGGSSGGGGAGVSW